MALVSTASTKAGNGLGGKTHIMSVATGTDMAGVAAEAQTEGFTVAAVEGVANGNHIALQGTGTPSITNAVLVATFED
jgi:hypothetical protein